MVATPPVTWITSPHVPHVLPHGGVGLSQPITSQYSPSGRPVTNVSVMSDPSLLITMNPTSPRENAMALLPLSHLKKKNKRDIQQLNFSIICVSIYQSLTQKLKIQYY